MSHLLASIGKAFGTDLDPGKERGKRNLVWLGVCGLLAGGLAVVAGPWQALAAVGSLTVVAIAFWRPELVLYFLAAYVPFEPFLLKFVPDELYVYARYSSEGLIYALVAAVIWRLFTKRNRFVATSLDLPFVFFLIVALASLVLNSVAPFTGILGLRQIIRFVLIFFVVVYLAPEERFARRITALMLGIVALQAFIGITQAVTGGAIDEFLIPSERRFYESIQLTTGSQQTWSPGTRVFATLGRYDQLGSFLAFFMLLAVGLLYQRSSDEQKRQLVTVIALASPALLLSGSRASWFGFILGLLAIGAWLMRDKRIRYGFAALIATAVLYAAWSGLAVKYLIDYPEQTVVERFFEAFSFERWRGEYYGLGRFYWMVQTPLVVVRSAPVFGVGPGQYGGGAAAALGNTTVYEKLNLPFGVYGTEGYIDNSWFALWGETGTLGLIFYAWMFWAMFRTALATWRGAHSQFARGLALGFAGCLVAVTFQAFLATYLEIRTLALYVWLYGALVFVLARREKVIT